MANATNNGNDIEAVCDQIADNFQQYAATATSLFSVVWQGVAFNVSSVLTVASATAAVGTTLGTIALTTQVGGLGRLAAMRQILKAGFVALLAADPGTTQVQSFSAGASTTWNTSVNTITRL